MESLAAYYTKSCVSDLLVSALSLTNAEQILDLGAGTGSLLKSALARWPEGKVIAAEVDPKSVKKLQNNFPDIHLVLTDGLYAHQCPHLAVEPASIDIAVCNPPYLSLKEIEPYQSLLIEAGLPNCTKMPRLSSDIIFLAQSLRLLRKGGELGIILPDSLITGKRFEILRKDLIENHGLFGVIQMPDKAFQKTEALTHILLLRKGAQTKNTIPVYLADKNMSLSEPLNIPALDIVERMDYQYWSWSLSVNNNRENNLTLESIGAEIKRGTITRKNCLEQEIKYFHTSDFSRTKNKTGFLRCQFSSKRMAKKGDILLARVGKRCIGRVTLVTKGRVVITDCVYRIRVPEQYIQLLLKSLISDQGQKWLSAHAHGVCAQVISKYDLLNFPVVDC